VADPARSRTDMSDPGSEPEPPPPIPRGHPAAGARRGHPRAAHRLAPAPADRGARATHTDSWDRPIGTVRSRAATTRPSPVRRGCHRIATSACRRPAGAGCGGFVGAAARARARRRSSSSAFLLFQPFHGKGY
jgi:hypothetical protein